MSGFTQSAKPLAVHPCAVLFALLALLSPAQSATAQIPNEFTNLKLLPADIEQRHLVGTMRDWAGSLGVRCSYCHVGPDNLQGMDFASDEKATKRTARRMLAMTREINGPLLDGLPTVEEKHQVVSCYTCHRRQATPPRNTLSILVERATEEGVPAAIAEYERLVGEHGDDGAYDLSPGVLERVARRRLEARAGEDAVSLLEYAVERFPRSASTHATLGLALVELGRPTGARPSLERALELDPDQEWARRALERIDGTP